MYNSGHQHLFYNKHLHSMQYQKENRITQTVVCTVIAISSITKTT